MTDTVPYTPGVGTGLNISDFADAFKGERSSKDLTVPLYVGDADEGTRRQVGQVNLTYTPGLMTASLEDKLRDIRMQTASGVIFSEELIVTMVQKWDLAQGKNSRGEDNVIPITARGLREALNDLPEITTQIALAVTEDMQGDDPKAPKAISRRGSSTAKTR